MTLKLAATHLAWTGEKEIKGDLIADAAHDGYDVEIFRANTGRITIRCSYWHTEQDVSREGYLLDHRVSGPNLETALDRAREAGYPRTPLMEAVSAAEEAISL